MNSEMKRINFPKISIITPSFNQGEYLERTIKSVIDQNYPNLEYIVIDGGSTDNSVEIIKKYSDKIHCWISEKDDGQSDAINKGLKIATGEIIGYCNSDDIYMPNCLNRVADCFAKNDDTVLIYGDGLFINENDRILDEKREIEFDYFMACCLGFGRIVFDPSTFFKRRLLDEIGYLNIDLHYIMDGDFFFRAAQVGKIMHVNEIFAAMRRHIMAKSLNSSTDKERYEKEYYGELKRSYETLGIAKIITYQNFLKLRKVFRLKRIMLRFLKGQYFYKIKYRMREIYACK